MRPPSAHFRAIRGAVTLKPVVENVPDAIAEFSAPFVARIETSTCSKSPTPNPASPRVRWAIAAPILGRNLRECTESDETPGTIRHTSIHKAKGLDAKAVILIGLQAHPDLSTDYDHYSWFMAVSRARQLLAIVEDARCD